MNEAKVIQFNGRGYHYVGMMWAEPWREPEIRGDAAWIQNRHPEIDFTPVRWRFVCLEGVIAAVPIGYFDDRGPEKSPSEIRPKTAWLERWEDCQAKPWQNGTRIRRPEGTKRLVLSEEIAALASITRRCPALSNDEALELLNYFRFEGVYDDGRQSDYFVSVDVLDPMAHEAAMIREHQPSEKPMIFFGDNFKTVRGPGAKDCVSFKESPKVEIFRKLFKNWKEGNRAMPWREVATDAGFTTGMDESPRKRLISNRGNPERAEIVERLISAIICERPIEGGYTVELSSSFTYFADT